MVSLASLDVQASQVIRVWRGRLVCLDSQDLKESQVNLVNPSSRSPGVKVNLEKEVFLVDQDTRGKQVMMVRWVHLVLKAQQDTKDSLVFQDLLDYQVRREIQD